MLIIEDEWLIAEYLVDVVEEAGATSTVMAATEDDAIRAAHEHMPDIILSDVNLRAGTGPCAVQTILSALGEIPVIFITGRPDACHPRQPSHVLLSKPADRAHVITAFRRLASGLLSSKH